LKRLEKSSVKSRTVLVTGASGFLGRRLVPALCAAGWNVIGVSRSGRATIQGIRIIELDLEAEVEAGRFSTLDDLIPHLDALCHLAAFKPPQQNDPQYVSRCLRVNAELTLQLALWAARKGFPLLYASAANMYVRKEMQPEPPAHEEESVYPAAGACFYLSSKLAGELFLEHARRTLGLSAIILRIASIFGPGMPEQSCAARFLSAAAAGGKLDVWGGKARHDWVYVHDVVAAVIMALQSGDQGVYNIASGESHTVLELAKLAAEVYSDRRPTIRVRTAEGPEDLGYRPVSIEKAQQAWGFSPRGLVESIRDYRRAAEAVA
jgi:nucleoside-diphosphate-sugar epimerase